MDAGNKAQSGDGRVNRCFLLRQAFSATGQFLDGLPVYQSSQAVVPGGGSDFSWRIPGVVRPAVNGSPGGLRRGSGGGGEHVELLPYERTGRVCLDLDDTLCSPAEVPVEGALDLCRRIAGCKIPFEKVAAEKISSELYVCSRSYRFAGDWPNEIPRVLARLPKIETP